MKKCILCSKSYHSRDVVVRHLKDVHGITDVMLIQKFIEEEA